MTDRGGEEKKGVVGGGRERERRGGEREREGGGRGER